MYKILVVEDAEDQQKILKRTFSGYQVLCVANADMASETIKNNEIDLLILDINLPQRDGYSLLNELRDDLNKRSIPVFCVSGRNDITDKVTAFSLGVDDYIVKPYDPIELRARVEGKLKKSPRNRNADVLTVGNLKIDFGRHKVWMETPENAHAEIDLSPIEFKLLQCLSRRSEQVYTREQLILAAWGDNAEVSGRVVDVHIHFLRKKLGPLASYIKSVTGVGYKIDASKPI